MKKLKLESLEITSFPTTAAPARGRGTLRAHESIGPAPESEFGPCVPTDVNYDCTYGCTANTGCPDECDRIPTIVCP
ncbi:MAG TPA: hypothetical protein VF665_05305 [Longimicrobium sp.]|jgi:hypothetical protein|uniref:hypothetical protein n=1 Tax=Longimicrobium sp. TaxID=2029185 RepID=UPI002ED85151